MTGTLRVSEGRKKRHSTFLSIASSPTSFHITNVMSDDWNLSGKRTTIAGEGKTNRIDEFSEKGQTDKFPLKNGDLFT